MSLVEARRILQLTDIDVLTAAILKSKWKQLLKENHPDKHATEGQIVVDRYNQICVEINNAYDYLVMHIDEYNAKYGKKTRSSFDSEPDFIFFINRSKVEKNMKAYFEGCKGSILKKQVIDFYYNEVKIEEANTEYEVREAIKRFKKGIISVYKDYQMFHCIDNGIPEHFAYNLDYNCNCDEFLNQLYAMKEAHETKVSQRVKNALDNQLIDEYLLNTDVFKDEICTMMAGMFSYTISPEEERRIISDITSRASRINRYFVNRSKEFMKLRKLVLSLPADYDVTGYTKKQLLDLLDNSIIVRNFDDVKDDIRNEAESFIKKTKLIKTLHRMLTIKSNIALMGLDSSKDQARIQGIYQTLAEVNNVLAEASKGKYTYEDLSCLMNVSFKDKASDDFIISMVGNGEYKIHVSMPKNQKMGYVNTQPFVLMTPDKSQFLSLDERDAVLTDVYNYAKENLIIPVEEFLTRGNAIFKYRYHGNKVELVICEYFGLELSCELDRKTGNINYFYVTDAKSYDFLYRDCKGSFSVFEDIEKYSKEIYGPYIEKMQGKTASQRKLNIKA